MIMTLDRHQHPLTHKVNPRATNVATVPGVRKMAKDLS